MDKKEMVVIPTTNLINLKSNTMKTQCKCKHNFECCKIML